MFGQGPDVGNQYRYNCLFIGCLCETAFSLNGLLHVNRSIIFTNGSEESRLAAVTKEREQTRSKGSIVTTQIQQIETFYPAEPEHQVRYSLMGNVVIPKNDTVAGCNSVLEQIYRVGLSKH